MNKNELVELLKEIDSYYPGKIKRDDVPKTIISWHRILKDEEKEVVFNNLMNHVKVSAFLPTVSDLIKVDKVQSRSVPNFKETQAILKKYDERDPATEEIRLQALKEIRSILGIEKEGTAHGE